MCAAPHESSVFSGERRCAGVSWIPMLAAALFLSAAAHSTVLAHGDDPCDEDKVLEAKPRFRLEAALEMIRGGCMSIPGPIWYVIQKGDYPDGVIVSMHDRVLMINTAIAAGHAEAESLSVSVLENGGFPDGPQIEPTTGAMILEGLAPALNPYRVGLLLDIYEQINQPEVRNAVIRTLRSSDRPEALLPALDAYWMSPPARAEAMATFAEEPDKDPDAILARVIGVLPSGPALDWAARLTEKSQGALSTKAARARGK